MEFLGIGPLELLFIVLIALIILGPKDVEKTGKSIGRGLTKLVKSDTWKTVRQTSDKLKSLPDELMREAGIEDMKQSLDSEIIQPVKDTQKALNSWENGSPVSESGPSEKDPTEIQLSDPNKFVSPPPNEEQSK
jgi:Sec-independent protein translocase protein TatA